MTPNANTPGRARLMGIALLVITFVVGAIAGAAADRVLVAGTANVVAKQETRRDDRGDRHRNLFDQLDLTADQQARVDAILARRKEQLGAFWDDAGPRLRALVDTARAEIRSTLTPAQQAEYDRLREEHRRRSRCDRGRETSERDR